jgi:hypothetical protein
LPSICIEAALVADASTMDDDAAGINRPLAAAKHALIEY